MVKGRKLKGYKVSEYWLVCHNIDGPNKRINGHTVERIKKRYNYECQICGEKNKYTAELHHIKPLEIGGKNTLNNLVCLCANCHRKVHAPLENILVA